MNPHCFRDYCPSHNTFLKVQTQGSNNKNSSHFEKSKPKDPKPVLLRDNAVVEPAKKEDKKNKKKRFWEQRQEYTREQKE